ncbi:glycosyltransferase N-terminal domain-containing protein [Arcobacter nitrofigilis]|uniref:glycosyltransferase N-terminal domain-containing protein n=1 Tax=Arcobacter nitrofigilis TaxID=28199 RepID=UPI000315A4A7|nr:glycosyltransferase N-terminal domain-containing protein [Arcobacter nitrofigilis]
MSLFSIFYFLVSLLLYILAIPFILFKSKNKKYKKALPSRFFLKDNNSFSESKIWFHVCSFGETKAIKPIVEALNEDVNISVITNTGFDEAKKLSKNVRFLPYELFLPFWIKKQKVLLVMEAELWYMLFLIAKIKKTKTILINARISDKSYKSYKKFSWFYKRIFKNIDKVFAQSEIDKNRLEELGAKKCGSNRKYKISHTTKKKQ